jgi:hypothetical protein
MPCSLKASAAKPYSTVVPRVWIMVVIINSSLGGGDQRRQPLVRSRAHQRTGARGAP